MLNFSPAQVRPAMGRTVARALGEPVPPPAPDTIFTGYTGMPGFVETFAVIAVAGAAAWVGVRTGMGDGSRAMRTAGWIGGVGSAILGLLYLGGRTGYGHDIGLPSVRVVPG